MAVAVKMNQQELERRHELGEFLRSRRERVTPESVGLARGTRRRTAGLRRVEVATLAGMSPEWYTWLEQGRDIHVSGQVLESLARVLHLDDDERAHLFLLAQRQPPPVETFAAPIVSPTLQRFLDHLGAIPASAMDIRLNVVAGNEAYRVVFRVGNSGITSERERNLIWRLFTYPAARAINHEWEAIASSYLAQFRAGYARAINDPWWAEFIADLSEISPEFRKLWAQHAVQNIAQGRKVMEHPLVGEMSFDTLWFQAVDASDLRVLIHTPRDGTDTAAKIERLLALASLAVEAAGD